MHREYAKYLARHKAFVFEECCRFGVPWLGVIHDLSKLRPDEWLPYHRNFYTTPANAAHIARALRLGQPTPKWTEARVLNEFNYARLLHQKRNPHHWQYWILVNDDNPSPYAMQMPEKYVREMVSHWYSVRRESGKPRDKTLDWYGDHCSKMFLHAKSRAMVEWLLGVETSYVTSNPMALRERARLERESRRWPA